MSIFQNIVDKLAAIDIKFDNELQDLLQLSSFFDMLGSPYHLDQFNYEWDIFNVNNVEESMINEEVWRNELILITFSTMLETLTIQSQQ